MENVHLHPIQVAGLVEEREIAPFSPPGLKNMLDNLDSSTLLVATDQSGLVGLIRCLHGLRLFYWHFVQNRVKLLSSGVRGMGFPHRLSSNRIGFFEEKQ